MERKRFRSASYSDSEYTHSEDERPRKNGRYWYFTSTSLELTKGTSARWQGEPRSQPDDDENMSMPSMAAVDTSMTGDEAYQRRLAMSQGSTQHFSAPDSASDTALVPSMAESGEEAYLRRLAMSRGQSTSVTTSQYTPDVSSVPPPIESTPDSTDSTLNTTLQPPAVATSGDFEERVRSGREAAAAVAARLAKLAAAAPPEAPQEPPKSDEK